MVYLVVPLIFVRMGMQQRGEGFYRILIPHLVAFFWWQISLVFYAHSSWFGLARVLVGWVSLLVSNYVLQGLIL